MIELTMRCKERIDAHGKKFLVRPHMIYAVEGRQDSDGAEYALISIERPMQGASYQTVMETVEQIKTLIGSR